MRLRLDDTGARSVVTRWEWDLQPPAVGTRLAIVVVPGTLRFFTSSGHAVDRHPRATPRRADPARAELAAVEPSEAPAESSEVDVDPPSSGHENGNGNGHLPGEAISLRPPAPSDADVRHRELPSVE